MKKHSHIIADLYKVNSLTVITWRKKLEDFEEMNEEIMKYWDTFDNVAQALLYLLLKYTEHRLHALLWLPKMLSPFIQVHLFFY